MRPNRFGLSACCLAALLTGCGGGGGSGGGTATPAPTPAATASPSPTPTPSPSADTGTCSLRSRQDWALAQLQEWYLFPSLLDTTVNPAAHSTVQSYIDALVAPARAQNRDRYFTYLTSISEENAYYEEGETAGFGVRFGFDGARLAVTEAFEGGPALGHGIDRGTQILGIGTSTADLRSVSAILAAGGVEGLVNALGPDAVGVSRVLQFRDASGVERTATVTKTAFELDPVSDRYGARIIEDGGRRVGYLNLRTFIDTAEPDLRAAFAAFKAQGVTELIIDLRYNGGGLISVAELLSNLMAGGHGGHKMGFITFRDSKAEENETVAFEEQPETITPTKVAFIGTGSTASASELVINVFVPYFHNRMALVGSNTYGKPVGQVPLDMPECDDRLRAVALEFKNASSQGGYYTGLASVVPASCAAADDISHQLGDPNEAMVRTALDYIAGRSCTRISAQTGASAAAAGARVGTPAQRQPLVPAMPRSTIEREVPGAF